MAPAASRFVLLGALLWAAPAVAVPQSEVQQKCIREIHKHAAAVVKAQGRLNLVCLKQGSRGQLGGLSWTGCIDADADGKVARVGDKTHAGRERKCDEAELPSELLALDAAGDVEAIIQAARGASLGLGDDILARPATVVMSAGDKLGAKCQAEALKRTHKMHDLLWKEALGAANDALAAGAASSMDVSGALETALAASPRLAKAEQQLVAKLGRKCAEVNAPLIFRGVCSRATPEEVATCSRERARCRLCLALDALEGLPLDCDLFDDGELDLSCSAFF